MKMIDQLPFATNQDRTEEAAKYWSFVSGADLYNQILTGGGVDDTGFRKDGSASSAMRDIGGA